jgi:hypothetical protein
VSILPQKPGPQLWEDVVLPIFDQPEPDQPRERSKKQDDDERRVRYQRYKGARTPCRDCTDARQDGGIAGVTNSTWVRSEGEDRRYLCSRHKVERENEELLRGNVG